MKRTTLGFSLIELLVVLVIVGIVAVVTGNWYGAAQPSAVKGTVNAIAGTLLEARTVARTTGRTVTLSTSGAQEQLQIAFPSQGDVTPVPVGQALTLWRRNASGRDATRSAGIESSASWPIHAQSAPNPDPLAGRVTAISALCTSGAFPGTTGQLFTGVDDSKFSFDAMGRANTDFYVFVGGMRSGKSYSSAPVGLVLVSRTNGIHAFYKPNAGDATVPWQRL